ncbi:adenylate/guanylate cyclase domain-containing protein [Ruegeria atlantica]|uniref:adenylate/guanylate cyclase domain-containing protein n=1 Tax=Ruegeria atlantica TaxID=81569 RepID=UPI002494DF87|nr:adenylate/guanylate cyclase domain-containing protein [Ruegeria atlantica]
MADREKDNPEDRRIAYRIGVHLGDIIIDGDDIFGDGVNVASRLEGLAEAGSIRISEAVFNNVKGKLDLGFADLGPQKVKNISEPVQTFQVLLDPSDAGKLVKATLTRLPLVRYGALAMIALVVAIAAGLYARDRMFAPTSTGPPKLLVLPLAAADAGSRLIAEAATENLIASFARLKGLTIAPRDVSMQYKGIELAASDVPDDLDVRYILDGTAISQADSVEISARLRDISASGEDVVWEQKEVGKTDELFGVLAMLKLGATAAMKVRLNQTERAILESKPTTSFEAYLAFAQAELFRYSGNFFDLEKSLPLYEKSINLDPGFIAAHVGYAEANFTIWSMGYNTIRYTLDALDAARESIETILQAQDANVYAIGLQVRIEIELSNHEQALAKARAAVFLQPDEPWLRFVLGLSSLAAGNYEESLQELDKYQSLSPRLNSGETRDLSFSFLLLDDVEQALGLLKQTPPEESTKIDQYSQLANAYARRGELEEAKFYMAKFLKETVWNNLAWQRGYFGRYADPALYDRWSEAMRAAGLPESPFDFEAGREADRLQHDNLIELFSDIYQETQTLGPFGMPYSQDRSTDGTLTMNFAWMKGQPISGNWSIEGDQFCVRTPAIHVNREQCLNVYIDRDKSTEKVTHISTVYSFGALNFEFTRVSE